MTQTLRAQIAQLFAREVPRLPEHLGALGAVALLFSVAYEAGFFTLIGFDLFNLLGPTDFLKIAISWVPILGSVFIAHVFIGDHIDNLDPSQTERWLPASVQASLVVVLAAAIGISVYLTPDDLYPSAVLLAGVVFFSMALATRKFGAFRASTVALVGVGLIGSMSFTLGLRAARAALAPPFNPYVISTSTHPVQLVNLLRITEKGVLFTRPPNGPEFAPWDDVKRLLKPARYYGPGGTAGDRIRAWFGGAQIHSP